MTYALATVSTHYDLLHSTIAPQDLLDTAQQLRLPAVGIVDRATTLSHAPLAVLARDTGVHIAYGATLQMEDGYPMRLLARNEDGYRNLCRLVSWQAQKQERVSWEMLRQHNHGLYMLCGGRRSRLWQAIADGDTRVLTQLVRLQTLGERDDRFVVEVQQYDQDTADDHRILRTLLELTQEAGVRAIATHDAQIIDPADASKHRLLHAIGQQLPFWSEDPRLPPWRANVPSRFALPTPQAWYRRWEGLDHLVAANTAILNDCDVELLGKRRFPGATLPAGKIFDDLWNRAFIGLRQRYAQLRPDLMERLSYEVNEVQAQGVGAFLIHAAELVERASKRGIKMVLQGSGTGSLLCYALGISPVDPMSSEAEALVFERFAGAHRGQHDLPDLDFGVPAGRETEVRQILVDMFGQERVASLAAVVTLRERGAIRVAATAFGFDRNQIRMLHDKLKWEEPLDREEQMVVNAAHEIEGQPSNLMRHSSGVIIADEPLASLYGVGSCPDGPLLLANKDDVEALQFLKFDILLWYVLAIFDQAERSIHASVYPRPDVWHVSGSDERTGDILEQADTRCIPYLQSPACMTIIRALRVRNEADIALALGALRPGASHTRERLMAAIHGGMATLPGWDKLTPEHQAVVESTLAPSRGALIFDEDLLRLAHVIGFSYADAERLRKAMKKGETDGPMTNKFRAVAIANGWSHTEIEVIVGWFGYIRRYTFTRGHAVAMAFVAWRTARLSAHYPTHFYAAVLDWLGLGVGGGMYPILVYVIEARRHGIAVRGPTINGPWESMPKDNAVQCGLKVLQSALNLATLERIHAAARERPFSSIADLCQRVHLGGNEIEKLIASGALDELAPGRRHARWEVQYAYTLRSDQSSLLDDQSWQRPMEIDLETQEERAWEEYDTLGFTLTVDHPLDLMGDALDGHHIVVAEQLRHHVGQLVDVAGVIVAGRRIHTSGDKLMVFASLNDHSGTMELTLFSEAAERYGEQVSEGGMVVVRGMVTSNFERGIGVEVQALRQLDA